jgi:nicotinamide/nicotinate riboside kinase
VQSDTAEGSLWRDPPHYWEQIVWPAYVEAHRDVFENGDVGHGKVNAGKVKHLILLEGMSMEDLVINSCEVLKHYVRNIQDTENV